MGEAARATGTEPPPVDDRTFSRAALGLAAFHAVLGALLFEPTLFTGGDNAGYLILGEALRGGEGYRDLYLPGMPLHAKYPPVLPAMLAVLGWFGGVQLFKLAMLACTSAAVWATARLGRGLVGGRAALAAAALLAVNPTLLEYGHYILSEAPFVLFVVLALLAAGRPDRTGAALAIAAAVAAFGTRTAGLTILAALPIAWVLAREGRKAIAAGAAAAIAMAAWAVYQGWAAPDQASYFEELVLVDPYDPAAGSVGLAGLVARAASNLWAYAGRVVPQTLLGTAGPPSTPVTLLGIAISALALVGWARRAGKRVGAAELFMVLYVGLIAVWPSVWTDRRFLLPAVPLLLIYAVGGLGALPTRASAAGRRVALVALLVAIGLPATLAVATRIPDRVECVARYRTGAPCDPPPLASLYAAAAWARSETPPEAIIVNRKPRLFWWYARRRGDIYPYSADPATVLRAMDAMGADYVVVDQVSGTTARYLIPAIQASAGRFELVYEGGTPPTFVFRLAPAPANAE